MRNVMVLVTVLAAFLLAGCGTGAAETAVNPVIPVLPPPAVTISTPSFVAENVPPTPSPTQTPFPTQTPQPTATLPPPAMSNPLLPQFVDVAAAYDAAVSVWQPETTGIWQYAENSFLHPIALDVLDNTLFMVDGGRVLALNLSAPEPPQLMLQPGDFVEGVRVLEPLDLTVSGPFVLVLDRAGDVYRFDPSAQAWYLDRYDRAVSDSSGHYYVALGAVGDNGRYLAETNYKYTMYYRPGGSHHDALWPLLDVRVVDLAAAGSRVYVLAAEPDTLAGQVNLYENTSLIRTFRANFPMLQVRQVAATETSVYVLDRNGRRLLQFDGRSGALQHVQQLPQNDPVSAFWVSPEGQIILAGRNRLYFGNDPARLGHVPPGTTFAPSQFYDPYFLAALPKLGLPIGGSPLTVRDFQLPGAPRHYRLGVHEGLDFYWQRGTPVTAVADGIVIRANTDFVQPSPAEIAAKWQAVTAQGFTDDASLDFYRGRQVWIEHANGLISRYVHLDTIAPGVQVGTAVKQGQIIGTVGNSGSPSSSESVDADVHLHFELWYDDAYLGQYLRPIETREWILQLFYNENQN